MNVIKIDLQVQIKMKDVLDKNFTLSYNYQSKIGYETLIQNVILKEISKSDQYCISKYR